ALSPVEVDSPGHARDAADAEHVVVGDGLEVVDVTDPGVHHPEVGPVRVADLAGGAQHHAAEDRALLGDEKTGEADAEDDGKVLAPVAHQHLQGDPGHGMPLSLGPRVTRLRNEGGAVLASAATPFGVPPGVPPDDPRAVKATCEPSAAGRRYAGFPLHPRQGTASARYLGEPIWSSLCENAHERGAVTVCQKKSCGLVKRTQPVGE